MRRTLATRSTLCLVIAGSTFGCGGGKNGQDAGPPDGSSTDAPRDGQHDGGGGDGSPGDGGGETSPGDSGCPGGETLCGTTCVNEQKDAKNCGGCGLTCSTSCVKGECIETVVTLKAGESPWALAIDSTSLYWTSQGKCSGDAGPATGAVMKAALDGSGVTTLASAQGAPVAIAVDATSVYWVDQNNCSGKGSVVKTDLAGSGTLVTLASGLDQPSSIAIDATSVYFTTATAVLSVPLSGVTDGGAPTILASGQGQSAGVTVEGTDAFWAQSFGTGSIKSVAVTGGKTMNLTPMGGCGIVACAGAGGITSDAKNLYWSSLAAGEYMLYDIFALPLTGGTSTQLDTSQGTTTNLASDGKNVYWSSYGLLMGVFGHAIVKVGVAGGKDTTIASNQAYPRGIAVDAKSVYWANSGTPGAIMKATPK